jgi:imidazolonepropionase-like amidohydrolase
MAEAGLGAAAAIMAATSGSARALGLDSDLGTLEVGKTADLLVVDGDPTGDPSILLEPSCIWLVIQAGRAVAGQAVARRSPFA